MTRLAKAMSAFNFGRSGSADGRDAVALATRGASLDTEGSGASAIATLRRAPVLLLGVLAALLLPAAASAACPNEEIRAAQKSSALPNGTVDLPDCMALEQVSATKKENQYAKLPEISADAQRIRYYSGGAIEDPDNLLSAFWNRYVGSRGASGWASVAAAPTDPEVNSGKGSANGDIFSPDFSSWFHLAGTSPQVSLGVGRVYRGGVDSFFAPLSPLLTPLDAGAHAGPNLFEAQLHGASADHSRYYFTPGDQTTVYLPGDPEPAGSGAVRNAYVALLDSAGNPSLELLTRDGDGKAWGGNCGAGIGGIAGGFGATDRNQGAIAANGSRVYLTTRPDQSASGNCNAANRQRIMRRVETIAGPWITHVVPNGGAGECNRVAPACSLVAGDDLYQGASVDQTKVYFTTNRQLADTDLDGEGFLSGCTGFLIGGCDLYLYDSTEPVGKRLIQVSAGEDNASHEAGKEAKVQTGIAAISGDGSHVYFVAEGVLTDEPNPEGAVAQAGQKNLFMYQRNEEHPDGRLAFIGTAAANDSGLWNAASTFRGSAYPVPATGVDAEGNEVGGKGHVLLFESKASLTADDTDGGRTDIFRYDSEAETLERVTKAAPGGDDNGPFDLGNRLAIIGLAPVANIPGTDFAEMNRWASEDGETIVFRTAEGLVPEDTNGFMDSYLLRDGQLHLLPGTTDPLSGTISPAELRDRPVLSHDGSVVAFTSRELLLPSDGDSAIDVYSLRAEGGYPIAAEPVICAGEACQGDAAAAPGVTAAASAIAPSTGNVSSRPNRCQATSRRAQRLSQRAKRLRNGAKRAKSARQARRMRAQAQRASKRARNLSRNAKRCRQAGRRAAR